MAGRKPDHSAKTPKKCLTPGCNKPAGSRGLCDACRRSAYRAIAGDKSKEEQLVKRGKILPSRRPRRKSLWADFAGI